MNDATAVLIAQALEKIEKELKNTNQILISISRVLAAANVPRPPSR